MPPLQSAADHSTGPKNMCKKRRVGSAMISIFKFAPSGTLMLPNCKTHGRLLNCSLRRAWPQPPPSPVSITMRAGEVHTYANRIAKKTQA